MITTKDLASTLNKRGIADWVVVERVQEVGTVDERSKSRRVEQGTLWQVTVHYDSPSGRGSAYVVIDAADGNANAAVDQAIALAQSSIGPAWISRPLAAPARVKLEDLTLSKQPPLDIATDVIKKLARPTDVSARVRVLREHVSVVARQGFHADWIATHLSCEALVSTSKHSLLIMREARQRAALELDGALGDAKRDLDALGSASLPTAGPCALVLATDALLHEGLGVWAAFLSQSDAVVERQGLTRYRERTPIVNDAEKLAEPLTITSNGAAEYGVRSAPVGDQGEAIRRFVLVERGIAAGLGLTPREGALRGRDPNGGVRNLEVERGTWSGTIDARAVRVVEVKRLRSLSIDPYTGDASIEIALGIEHTSGGDKPFAGGAMRIDLIAALAKAKRSSHSITRGAYTGPNAVLIDRAELVA